MKNVSAKGEMQRMRLEQLLSILNEGKFLSGEMLAQRFGLSRTAIWNAIHKLKELGLDIQSVQGKGYRLANHTELLSKVKILAKLNLAASEICSSIEIMFSTNSTNQCVKDSLNKSKIPIICLAEMQQDGRGRRGRQWVSPFAVNIYFSMGWRFHQLEASLDGLSLCVGLALIRATHSMGINGLSLKWPNDLMFEGKKVAGVLIEIVGELSGPVQVVIGVGVNVAMTAAQGCDIDQNWTTLSNIAGHKISRNEMVAHIINHLVDILPQFERGGFMVFKDEWAKYDALEGLAIEVDMIAKKLNGVACGVDASGELLMKTNSGVKQIRGGEVSVRSRG